MYKLLKLLIPNIKTRWKIARICINHQNAKEKLGARNKNLSCLIVQKHNNAEILLQSCDLVLNINGSQSLVDCMKDLLALESAASAIQAGHNGTV